MTDSVVTLGGIGLVLAAAPLAMDWLQGRGITRPDRRPAIIASFFNEVPPRPASDRDISGIRRLLQATLDALPAELSIVDGAGTAIAVNDAARRFLRETRGCHWAPGDNFLEHCKDFAGDSLADVILLNWRDLLSGEMPTLRGAYEILMDGHTRSMQVRITRFDFDRAPLFIVAHNDVTEITEAHREVDILSRQLLVTQEDERRRIAVELHDSTGQHLTAVGLALSRLRDRHNAYLGPPAPRELASALKDASVSLAEAQKEIRLISYLLHPPHLEEDGLVSSLNLFVQGFSRRSGLECRLSVRGELGELDFELKRTLYRVAQEALANTHRHANASHVEVELSRRGNVLTLTVSDNGRGLPEDFAIHNLQLGVGIPGMRARLRQLGGNLKISGTPLGVTLRAIVPLVLLSGDHEVIADRVAH